MENTEEHDNDRIPELHGKTKMEAIWPENWTRVFLHHQD